MRNPWKGQGAYNAVTLTCNGDHTVRGTPGTVPSSLFSASVLGVPVQDIHSTSTGVPETLFHQILSLRNKTSSWRSQETPILHILITSKKWSTVKRLRGVSFRLSPTCSQHQLFTPCQCRYHAWSARAWQQTASTLLSPTPIASLPQIGSSKATTLSMRHHSRL